MPGSLREEIQQRRPFESLDIEVFLNVLRTEDVLSWSVRRVLKSFGLSQPQYNVMRILRGAGPEGLACSHIADRMVARVPDITRLLDRLEASGYVTRQRCASDGRMVIAIATPKALDLLGQLDAPLRTVHSTQLGQLSDEEKQTLIALLEKCRAADAGEDDEGGSDANEQGAEA